MVAVASELFAEWWQCTRDEYDADTEFERSSNLKDYYECPTIYNARQNTGEMERKTTSRPMEKGVALHSLALENIVSWKVAGTCGAALASGRRVGQPCGKATANNDHPPYWCEDEKMWVCGTHAKGRKVVPVSETLTADEDYRVRQMAAAVRRNKVATEWMSHRHHEKAARSVDPETGIHKKALIDILLPSELRIVDLKSTERFSGESIWRTFDQHGWGFSLAHYESVIHDIALAKTGRHLPPFKWSIIVAESVAPYRVTDFPIPSDAQDVCREDHRQVLRDLAESKETGVWQQRPLELGTPQWFHFVHSAKRETSR